MRCNYSSRFFQLPSLQLLPVECPNCGAIRALKVAPSLHGNFYPDHDTLDGTAQERRRWKRVNGAWIIVEKGAEVHAK